MPKQRLIWNFVVFTHIPAQSLIIAQNCYFFLKLFYNNKLILTLILILKNLINLKYNLKFVLFKFIVNLIINLLYNVTQFCTRFFFCNNFFYFRF